LPFAGAKEEGGSAERFSRLFRKNSYVGPNLN
jgi:hypothetical protein